MNISVVIPTHNRFQLLLRLLENLFVAASEKKEIYVSYIVVFDELDDSNLLRLKALYPFVYVVQGNGDWWFTKSVNEGIKYNNSNIDSDYILIINDDVEVPVNYIENLMLAAENFPKSIIGSASVAIEDKNKVLFSGVKNIIWWRHKNVYYANDSENLSIVEPVRVRKSATLPGRGMLIPTVIIKDIGLLDELFPQYTSDDEIVLRAYKHGYQSYVCLDAVLYSHWKETGKDDLRLQPSFKKVIEGFFNRNSKLNLYKNARIISLYSHPIVVPLALSVNIIAVIKRLVTNKLSCK